MLKRIAKYLKPRSLYGRATLILVIPIFVIQLVVTAFLIERLFIEVTQQMTRAAALDIAYLRRTNDQMAADQLRIAVRAAEDGTTQRDLTDLSGKYVIDGFQTAFPDLIAVDLSRTKGTVHLHLPDAVYSFSRNRVSAQNPHQLLVGMLLASLLMTAIAILFMRNQIRPIQSLATAAEAFGKGQSTPFQVRGAAEVRRASHAFQAMRARIERHLEQRTLMLSGVSHDLRTPLTRMKLTLSMMEDSEDSAALQRDIKDMQQMLDEFLDFAHGDSTEASEAIDPSTLTTAVVAAFNETGAQIDLIDTTSNLSPIQGRRLALQRALENLITNAQRYGTEQRVTLEAGQSYVDFSVEDNGKGIPADQHDTALRPFTRLDTARNQDKGGSVGLGLAITADIARSHGGTLTLDQSPDLGGLKATLRIPR